MAVLMCEHRLLNADLRGRVAVVTGANCGIGFETAQQLARQGAEVVLACRNLDAAHAALARILAHCPGARIHAVYLDLADLSTVRAFVTRFLELHPRLDLLINNAGVMNTPALRTADGFELQFGVNHLGHFLLTALLLECLQQTPEARVINVSSCYHDVAQGREGRVDFDDLHFDQRPYDGWRAYAQSKLANVLHAKGLVLREGHTGLTAVSVHPGWVRTRLIRHTIPVWMQDTLMRPIGGLIGLIEPWEGAQTTLHAALSPSVVDHAGAFYSQVGLYRKGTGRASGWPMRSPNPHAHDVDVIERLYDVSSELVGL